MLGPELKGEKISLAPAREEFLPDFIRWFADPQINRYLSIICPPSLGQEREWIEHTARDPNTVHWTMVVDDQPIGVTGIHNIDWLNRGAITGTAIGVRAEWGKGYASEAVRLRTEFAFNQLGLERLETFSFAENLGMHKALQRSGYRRIGTRRRAMWREGSWHDTALFELLREDWLEGAGTLGR
ncbi:MAG TPA: GNAT family protein [Chloroflexota bacterium]|nr:GNAT family protein [Chloroflexota bacterium]